MQSAGNTNRQSFSEINITPLTDIFLVLLIIMMVVAPMMAQSRADIKPPQISSGAAVEQGKLTVEVTSDGTFYVEGKPVSAEGLVPVFKEKSVDMEEKNVVIRADKETRSGAVMKVLEAARDAQFAKVTVAGDALSKSRQSEFQSTSLDNQWEDSLQ